MRQSLLLALASFAFAFALPTPQGYDYDKSKAAAKEGAIPVAPVAEHAGTAPAPADAADTQDAPVSNIPSSVDDTTESANGDAHPAPASKAHQDLDSPATGTTTKSKKVIANLKQSNLPANDAHSDSAGSGAAPDTGNADGPPSKSNLDNASPALDDTSPTAPPNFGSADKDLSAPAGGVTGSTPPIAADLGNPKAPINGGSGINAAPASYAPAGGIGAGRPFGVNGPVDPTSDGLPRGGGIPPNGIPPQGSNLHSGVGGLPPLHGTGTSGAPPPGTGGIPPYGGDPATVPPPSGGIPPNYGSGGALYDPSVTPPSAGAFPGVPQLYPGGPASPYWPPAAGVGPVLSGGAGFGAGYGAGGAVPSSY